MPRKPIPDKPKKYTKNWSRSPGVYHSLPENEYHADRHAASKSQLDMVDQSPAHWKHGISSPHQPTPTLVMGSMVHALVLEPENFKDQFIVPPKINRRTNIGKAQWAEWQKSLLPRQTLVDQEHVDKANNMADSVWNNEQAAWILKDSIREVTVVWRDNKTFRTKMAAAMGDCEFLNRGSSDPFTTAEDDQLEPRQIISPDPTNMYCKARIDSWRPGDGIWADLKTTPDASPVGFSRSVYKFRYHVQAAFYTDGGVVHGVEPEHFAFICVESVAPYVCQVYRLTESAIELGRILYCRNLETLHLAKKSGEYPGYASQVLDIDLPAWAYNVETT